MKTNQREYCGISAAVEVCSGLARQACSLLIVLMVIFGASGQLQAKVDAGISGIVTDASGAVVAGAIGAGEVSGYGNRPETADQC